MKSRFYLFILIVFLSLYLIGFVYADEKKIDVTVAVVGNEANSQSFDNYISLDNFGGSGLEIENKAEGARDSSLVERGINPQYQKEFGELASSRLSNQLFFPIILIIIVIILIIIYFLGKGWKRKGLRRIKAKN